MSTVKSTPPTDPTFSCRTGFNEQTHFDPFLPSSPSDEELLPLSNGVSSGLGSSDTRSPAPLPNLNNFHLQPSQPILPSPFYPFPHNLLTTTGCHESSAASGSYGLSGIASPKNDFLSPSIYPSDNNYDDLSGRSETANCDDALFLDFGFLEAPEQEPNPNLVTGEQDQFLLEPTSADTYTSGNTHRVSNGTATHSSHLMSPMLTDRASPDSRADGASPPSHRFSAEDRGYRSKASLNGEDINGDNIHLSGPMQHTPALTGSSMADSPERSSLHLLARAPSPVFRVETYRRGDSPARVAPIPRRSGNKRRGSASSFLSVMPDGDLSEDGEDDALEFDSRQWQTRTSLAVGVEVTMSSPGRAGLDPEAREHISDVPIPNFKDQEERNQLSLKNADVEDWLARSETGGADGGNVSLSRSPPKSKGFGRRQRAKSAGDSNLSHANLMRLRADPSLNAGRHVPGPGLLINEESVNEESDSEVGTEERSDDEGSRLLESPPAATEVVDPLWQGPREFRPQEPVETNSPPPLYRAKVWQDPWYDSTDPEARIQPVTSNEAIMRYNQCAERIETLSHVATWGTRRLSESDLAGLFHRFTFSEKDPSKPKGERRSSFLDAAAKLLPKRRGSLLKRKESDASKTQATRAPDVEQPKRDSVGSQKESLEVPGPLQRKPSLSKIPKSPRINTGSAVAAMGNKLATLGASGSISATGTPTPSNPWTSVIKRSRSRSDLRRGPQSPVNLAGLWTKQGGPPMPSLASPANVRDETTHSKDLGDHDDEEEDDTAEEKGVTIDFSIRTDHIAPTLEGFKSNVRQLNPRLPVYMMDRVAQEQLRRYKKLVDFKVKHVQAIRNKRCPSGQHCPELGGEPTYLPSKSSGKEIQQSHTGFSVAGPSPSDDDANALADGIVTPAQFPPGVPMPPVKRLPAKFECSLCYKVKTFNKPSDWSKHVHEDVQPFTCTFPTCVEPKSFKRKADWVRHENERHRQLEWWQCNIGECTHKCFRKDNFVQHLVREHKLAEPRIKTAKASKPAVRGPSSQKTRKLHGDDLNQADESNDEIDYVWRLVEECRHETPKDPKDEPCKFCGNICGSWKKLTVHLAKHMEQISMPVLNIVKEADVTPDTIVSPIEQRLPPQTPISPPLRRSLPENRYQSSPYGLGAHNLSDVSASFGPTAGTPFQRHQPSTYPPPVPSPNQAHQYSYSHATSYTNGHYAGENSPSPQFDTINSQRGYNQLPSSRPDNVYGGMAVPLTSEPLSVPFMKEIAYQSMYGVKQHPHQQAFSSVPGDAPVYVYGNPTTSYPQQPSMDAPEQMQYSPMYSNAQCGSMRFPIKPMATPQQQPLQQEQEGYTYCQ